MAALFGRAAPTYDTVVPFFERFAGHLVATARLQRGDRVLDLACGRGAVLRAAAGVVGEDGFVLGVDLSEAMVECARDDLTARQIGDAAVELADAEKLNLDPVSFDAVLCGFGVFFFPSPAAAMAESYRVLRAGGRFVASTFVGGDSGFPWVGDVLDESGLGRPRSGRRSPLWFAAGLTSALRKAGFIDPVTSLVEERFLFTAVDEYIAWNWSHGGRGLLEAFTVAELARFRAALAERMVAHIVPGGYELLQRVELTIATRP